MLGRVIRRRQRRQMRRARRRSGVRALVFPLFLGLSLLWAGIWFGLRQLGLPLPGVDRLWPVFPILGGLLFYLGFLVSRRDYGVVMPGTLFLFSGVFFLPFSLGVLDWTEMERLWPVFPLILGSGFVALFVASLGRHPGLLVPAGLFLTTGIVALSLTMTPLATLVGTVGWPVAFLSGGAALVLLSLLLIGSRVLRVLLHARQ